MHRFWEGHRFREEHRTKRDIAPAAARSRICACYLQRMLALRWHCLPAACGVLLLALSGSLGCPVGTAERPGERTPEPRGGGAEAADRLHAVLLNGGGRPRINYYSHVDHLRRLLGVLAATGVLPSRIAVFSGDGADPAADQATREGGLPDDFWLLPRALARRLRPPIEYVDSSIEGYTLRPATRNALRDWFDSYGAGLSEGDTLLFYVTDHGEKNPDDLGDNRITLWGEALSVEQLRALLTRLDPEVRVVLLMSQCYSGAFANAAFGEGPQALPRGNVCGYFSAPPDREAHGCYAEVSGRDAVGHSHRIFDALASSPRLPDAQREALISDGTPDVPHATSSFFLARRLEMAAARGGHETADLADQLLEEALRTPREWEREIRLLDRLGHTFGMASARSLAELETQLEPLARLREQLDTFADRWSVAFEALRRASLAAFQVASPEWRTRLEGDALRALDAQQRRRELDRLLQALRAYLRGEPEREARLRVLHEKSAGAREARYRADVRLAAALRMQTLLMDLAGRHFARRHAALEERAALARLDRCEDLALTAAPQTRRVASKAPEPYPNLAAERQLLDALAPGWLGLRYRSPRASERGREDLPEGAAVVSEVFPESPALAAGLQVRDVILGPPERDFVERHALREWVMRGEVGRPQALRLLRDGRELVLRIALAPYPSQLPELPGPPQLGSAAPALELDYLPGIAPPETSGAHLLFFWATWCGPCKKALPELLAFGEERALPIIAITDEPTAEVEAYLRERPAPPLRIVATDPKRIHFRRYGVSGTPTFVLVDREGNVRHYQTGYEIPRGLRVEGWRWAHGENRQ